MSYYKDEIQLQILLKIEREKNKELRKTLEFYASGLEDPRKIDDDTDFVEGIGEIFGKRARKALDIK